jgi:hypothetical protein
MGIAAPLIGALTAATGVLPLDGVAEQVADRDAMFRGVAHHQVIEFAHAVSPNGNATQAAPAPAAPTPATTS